jgi:hypothetical protein
MMSTPDRHTALTLEEQQWVMLDQAMNPAKYEWLREQEEQEDEIRIQQGTRMTLHKCFTTGNTRIHNRDVTAIIIVAILCFICVFVCLCDGYLDDRFHRMQQARSPKCVDTMRPLKPFA